MGVIKTDDYFYDMSCDRCGISLSEDLIRRNPSMSRTPLLLKNGFDSQVWGRIRERLLKSRHIGGWRLNPRNLTVVCPSCPLIISKKGTKK